MNLNYRVWKEKNPYLLKGEENPFYKKHEENPYLKKKDVPVEKKENLLYGKINVEISDPIMTNPECPTVTEVDRFRLRKIPVHKDNPYMNWKFSSVNDIDPNHEAKCLKTISNNVRIDSFTVTPKPVNNEYLIDLDWKINEEFIDAVRIEQGECIESNDDTNECIKIKKVNFDIKQPDKDDIFNKTCFQQRKNSIKKDNPWLPLFETTQFVNIEQSKESSKNNDKEESGWSSFDVMDDDLQKKKLLNSCDEFEELIQVTETKEIKGTTESESEIKGDTESESETKEVTDSDSEIKETNDIKETNEIKEDTETITITEIIEITEIKEADEAIETTEIKESTETIETEIKETTEIATLEPDNPITFDRNAITNTPTPYVDRDPIAEFEVMGKANTVEKRLPDPNFYEKVEALQERLRLLFEHQKSEKKSNQQNQQAKEIIVTDDSKNMQMSESKTTLEKDDRAEPFVNRKNNLGATKKSGKVLHLVRDQLFKKETMDEKKVKQQASQITVSKNEVEYSPQLNVKLNGEIGYDHKMETQTSKLPDNTPTFILVGDRFVREDKALIDLDMNDLAPKNSSNGMVKSSPIALPPELQDIDYEGWYMQQIVEEIKNSLKASNAQPKIKPSGSFLEEFDLLL